MKINVALREQNYQKIGSERVKPPASSWGKSLRTAWTRCILLNLRSKIRQTATLLPLTLIYFCRSEGQFHTFIYDKRDEFNFHITNFLFLSSNIPASPDYCGIFFLGGGGGGSFGYFIIILFLDITPICELITELDFNTDFDLITEFWRFP